MEAKQKLFEQFKSSQGINKQEHSPNIYMIDFVDWILEQQKTGKAYVDFLDYLGFDYRNSNCAEIGKSVFDTIVRPFDTRIITPYAKDITKENTKKVIEGTFEVYDERPTIISLEGIYYPTRYELDTFMTQNMYSTLNLSRWAEQVHNKDLGNIIIGLFGKTTDKDKTVKIKQLEQLRDGLKRPYHVGYEEQNGNYFYVIGSENVTKKTRVKSR